MTGQFHPELGGQLYRNLHEIMKVKNLPVKNIIEYARKIDRTLNPAHGDYPFDFTELFGFTECGKMFSWLAERDGSEYLKSPEPGDTLVTGLGGQIDVMEKVHSFICELLIKKSIPDKDILIKALTYASLIDETISPTYDIFRVEELESKQRIYLN